MNIPRKIVFDLARARAFSAIATLSVFSLLSAATFWHVDAATKLFGKQSEAYISVEERLLLSEMLFLEPNPLMALEYNKIALPALASDDVAKVEFEFNDGILGEASNNAEWYLDNIGKYYVVKAVVDGDIYQQLYVLKKLNGEFAQSFLIEKIEADTKKMILVGRVYGTSV